ncbi:MAG: hypothetical protein HGA90_04630 [Alphaproteobacteria bacterium]|nr:hypothetical protein [Alphaproteobacteria bacterium]
MADEITPQSLQVLPPPEESAPPKRRRRRWLWVLGAFGILFILWLFFIFSVELLHYTESAAFCSSCHIMHPENTAYENSPHARAECGTCHIGPGAMAAFQAKLANLRYLWVYPTGSYEKPIPSPITSLRPVEVVCEQCHWPQKFYGDRLVVKTHYRDDEAMLRRYVGTVTVFGIGCGLLGSVVLTLLGWAFYPLVRVALGGSATKRPRVSEAFVAKTATALHESCIYPVMLTP